MLTAPVVADERAANHASGLQSWAVDYYRENTACTVASINRVERSEHAVSVTLDVEAATTAALAKGTAANRDDWMALHCPPAYHPVWAHNSEIFDVHIVAPSPGNTTLELSCASYHRIRNKQRRTNADTVLSRLRQLLTSRELN